MKLWDKIKRNTFNCVYNLDRALASLCGADPQDTMSGVFGKDQVTNPLAEEAVDVLDAIQKDHAELAAKRDEQLTKADAGNTQAPQ